MGARGKPGFNRRGASYISRVDRERIEQGLESQWEAERRERLSRPIRVESSRGDRRLSGDASHANDRRLLEELPPHWHEKNQ